MFIKRCFHPLIHRKHQKDITLNSWQLLWPSALRFSFSSIQYHSVLPRGLLMHHRSIMSQRVKLSEVEEKVNTLQAKPSQMPYEKEELLNAAVCRVDALEAELITTKKALHEALMRQEELLAYIDHQRKTRFRKKKFCW